MVRFWVGGALQFGQQIVGHPDSPPGLYQKPRARLGHLAEHFPVIVRAVACHAVKRQGAHEGEPVGLGQHGGSGEHPPPVLQIVGEILTGVEPLL